MTECNYKIQKNWLHTHPMIILLKIIHVHATEIYYTFNIISIMLKHQQTVAHKSDSAIITKSSVILGCKTLQPAMEQEGKGYPQQSKNRTTIILISIVHCQVPQCKATNHAVQSCISIFVGITVTFVWYITLPCGQKALQFWYLRFAKNQTHAIGIFTLEPHYHVKSCWQCVLRTCMKLTMHLHSNHNHSVQNLPQ